MSDFRHQNAILHFVLRAHCATAFAVLLNTQLPQRSRASEVGDESVVVLFATCRSSTNVFATLMKRLKDAYVVASLASWIWDLGHARLSIQSDGEPAILALVAAVRTEVIAHGCAEQIVCQSSPSGSHEFNGAAERTLQQARGMERVYLKHEREKTGSLFFPSLPWWAWALRHAA